MYEAVGMQRKVPFAFCGLSVSSLGGPGTVEETLFSWTERDDEPFTPNFCPCARAGNV